MILVIVASDQILPNICPDLEKSENILIANKKWMKYSKFSSTSNAIYEIVKLYKRKD